MASRVSPACIVSNHYWRHALPLFCRVYAAPGILRLLVECMQRQEYCGCWLTRMWTPAAGGRGLGDRERQQGQPRLQHFGTTFLVSLTVWMCPAFTDYTSSQEQCVCWLTRMCGPQLWEVVV